MSIRTISIKNSKKKKRTANYSLSAIYALTFLFSRDIYRMWRRGGCEFRMTKMVEKANREFLNGLLLLGTIHRS
jgi:hypothetical protein